MSCAQCGAGEQTGRFCVGCGRLVRRPVLSADVRPRSPLADQSTQPVLRFDRPSKPAVPAR